jgi:hypothetical protein
VCEALAERHPDAAVIVPPHSTAVPSGSAAAVPAQRDRHFQEIVEHRRMGVVDGVPEHNLVYSNLNASLPPRL